MLWKYSSCTNLFILSVSMSNVSVQTFHKIPSSTIVASFKFAPSDNTGSCVLSVLLPDACNIRLREKESEVCLCIPFICDLNTQSLWLGLTSSCLLKKNLYNESHRNQENLHSAVRGAGQKRHGTIDKRRYCGNVQSNIVILPVLFFFWSFTTYKWNSGVFCLSSVLLLVVGGFTYSRN